MRRGFLVGCALALIMAIGMVVGMAFDDDRTPMHESGRAPLNLYTVPDDAPPVVDIGRADGSGSTIRGSLYRAEWLVGNAIEPVAEKDEVPWGGPRQVSIHDDLALFIHSQVRPRNITVNIFTGAVTETGEPIGDPVTTLDCWLQDLESGPCRLAHDRSGRQLLRMPPLPKSRSVRVSVFASWPELRVADRTALSVDSASWVFHLDVREAGR